MIRAADAWPRADEERAAPRWGARGYLAACATIALIALLVPAERILLAAALCLFAACAIFGPAVDRVFAARQLSLVALLAIPPMFAGSAAAPGFVLSDASVRLGLVIAARVLITAVALNGLARRINPTALAELLESAGLRGLGFAFGVALNFLPALRVAAETTWHALRMRGGFRRQWLRGVTLLTLTVLTSALRRAEDIALAAEIRGFDPERPRPVALPWGRFDRLALAIGPALLAAFLLPWG